MCWYEQLDEKVREYLPDMTMEREVPLSKHTSFRIGGPARRLAFPANREQLVILMGLAESCGVKPFLLGRGTICWWTTGGWTRWSSRRRSI